MFNSCSLPPQESQESRSSTKPPALAGEQESAKAKDAQATVPEERTSDPQTISQDPKELRSMSLGRGQYRLRFVVSDKINPQRIEGQTKAIDTGDEYKRVHVYKADARPLEETDAQGRNLVQVTAVVHVIDNPLPLVPVAWGLAGLLGAGGGGYLLFSSAESFVEESSTDIVLIGASIFTVVLGINTLLQ